MMAKRPSSYKFSIEECDVENKSLLLEFREKRDEWLRLMNDDEHAVVKQIRELLWLFNVFSTIEETRRLEHESGGNSSALNTDIAKFINNGFAVTVVNGIRKLWDIKSKKSKRQIISLHRVIHEMKNEARLFTRENCVCHDGLPFDYEAVASDRNRQILEDHSNADKSSREERPETRGPKYPGMSRALHKSFDEVSAFYLKSKTRSRSEIIDKEVFERLEKHVEESGIERIIDVANKLLLHAGDQESRNFVRSRTNSISLDNFKIVLKAIYNSADFVCSRILMDNHLGGFRAAQRDVLEKLEHPWCAQTNFGAVGAVWRSFASEVSNWDASEKFIVSE
jgi:hypothetical protein